MDTSSDISSNILRIMDDCREYVYEASLGDMSAEQLKKIEDILNDPDVTTVLKVENNVQMGFGRVWDTEESRIAFVSFMPEGYLCYDSVTLELDDDIVCAVGHLDGRRSFDVPVSELISSQAELGFVKAKYVD